MMKITTRQWVWVVGLGLAATAFLVDRLWLSGETGGTAHVQASIRPEAPGTAGGSASHPPAVPGASGASAARAADRSAPQPTTPAVAAGVARARPGSLADRLTAFAASQELDPATTKDAFVPPESWVVRPKPADPPPEPPPPPPEPATRFGDDHTVTAVFLSDQGGGAIVNGRFLRIGGLIDGYRLVRVTASGAVLEAGGRQVELKFRKGAVSP